MGTWGTGISSNDTYADVYQDFMDMYNEGQSVQKITTHLIDSNQKTIDIEDDAPNFWYAIVYAQWECGALDEDMLSKVEDLIVTGKDIRIWESLDASPADIKVRQKVLDKFLTKLKTPKDKAKKRVKKKLFDSIFKKGNCLVYIMDNGNYGGAFVLTDEENTPVGLNYIVLTTIDQSKKPVLKDFENANVYVQHREEIFLENNELKKRYVDRPYIYGYAASLYKKSEIEIVVIGDIAIINEYEIAPSLSQWNKLRSVLSSDHQYVEKNGLPKSALTLSEWIAKRPWFGKFFNKK